MNTRRTGLVLMSGRKSATGRVPRSSASRWKNGIGAAILSVASVAFSTSLGAVETGGSNWVMGSTGFNAGVVPKPGFHYSNLTVVTDFSTNQDTTVGNAVVKKLDLDVGINFFIPTYAGEIERWNARYLVLAAIPMVFLDGTFRVEGAPNESGHKDWQLGDVGFESAIGWRADDLFGAEGLGLDYKTGLLVVTPTGRYEQKRS